MKVGSEPTKKRKSGLPGSKISTLSAPSPKRKTSDSTIRNCGKLTKLTIFQLSSNLNFAKMFLFQSLKIAIKTEKPQPS
jgi:hypothetical protein